MMHERLQERPGNTMSFGQRCATEAFSASLFGANLWAISWLPSFKHNERQTDLHCLG